MIMLKVGGYLIDDLKCQYLYITKCLYLNINYITSSFCTPSLTCSGKALRMEFIEHHYQITFDATSRDRDGHRELLTVSHFLRIPAAPSVPSAHTLLFRSTTKGDRYCTESIPFVKGLSPPRGRQFRPSHFSTNNRAVFDSLLPFCSWNRPDM